LSGGWLDMNYKWEFEKFWGKNAKPETITLSQSDFDALTERLNEKPDPKALESIRKLLDRRAPWDT
jgi:PHD/YefM family antitoxin component YafN of YafNO toxin-antitoxin module